MMLKFCFKTFSGCDCGRMDGATTDDTQMGHMLVSAEAG